MRNKIYYASYVKTLNELNKKIVTAIEKAMTEMNVKVISFMRNGDNSEWDMPRAYCHLTDQSNGDISISEVLAVGIINGHLSILIEESVPDNEWGYIIASLEEGDVITPKAWDELNIADSCWISSNSDEVDNINTLLDLAAAINIILEEKLHGKPIVKDDMIFFD